MLLRGFQVIVCKKAVNESNISGGTCAGIDLESPSQISNLLLFRSLSLLFTFCHVQTLANGICSEETEQRAFLPFP